VAATDYETPDIWTEDTISAFLQKRKNLHNEALNESGYDKRQTRRQSYKVQITNLDNFYKMDCIPREYLVQILHI
jgi:hypothetical protein